MSTGVSVHGLRCEYHENPLGIGVLQPRLSWQLVSNRRGVVQSAYQIRVTDESSELWDTGKVLSDRSIHVPYGGLPLRSGQRCTWQVRVWDDKDQSSEWSDPARWEMGLLDASDWQARWIEPDWDEDPEAFKPAPYLCTTFAVKGKVSSARIYITCHGLYELSLNGQRVGDQVFTPGFTSYQDRLQYQTYDVGGMLTEGENAIGVILGDGWFRGKVNANSWRNVYGERLALLAQLHVRYQDGSEDLVVSDAGWKATTGPILKSDLKDGEVYDARLEMPGWDQAGYERGDWRGVRVVDHGYDNLVAPIGPPVRRKETFRPVGILETPNGETVVDLGQNIAGRLRLRVQGPAGTTIMMTHGEALDAAGNFSIEHLQVPQIGIEVEQRVQYTLKGGEEEVYEPLFTVHGFRYVKVEGFPGQPTAGNFTGVAIYSDMPPAGTFSCSSPLLNQLQHNIEWSMKGNFLDIPTDCPTRERAGWTGDAQIFCRTGAFLMDTASFFDKWLKDMTVDQRKDGRISNWVPNPARYVEGKTIDFIEGSAGWGDAAVIIPWTLYWCYGDERFLEAQYETMKGWVEYERALARNSHWTKRVNPLLWFDKAARERQPYIWDTKYHWGEWLEPDSGLGASLLTGLLQRALFSVPHVATAYFGYSARLLAEAARVLDKEEDAREYGELFERIRTAYAAEFVREDGTIKPHKQASYVRVLALDLLPEALRPVALQHLLELIGEANVHIGTGFLSTPFLCHVLSENGQLEVAYDLLNQDTIPSWLYAVTKGATTIWESWDGIREDGTVNGSLNHYSYGAIGSWLYQVVAGIEIGAPGYKHILIQPQPGGGLTHARATYQSVHGEIASAWEIADDTFRLSVAIPPNTTATVRLPGATLSGVTEGGKPLPGVDGVTDAEQGGTTVVVQVGSGQYQFNWSLL